MGSFLLDMQGFWAYFYNMDDLRKLVGKNLTELRKRKGLTQLKLAEIFNYTDRAVSKWESGETLPDVEVLYNLCEFYGVTLDYLTHEDNEKYIKKDAKLEKKNQIAITSLVAFIPWMIATIVFVYSLLKSNIPPLWQSFVWAVPVTSIICVLFNKFYYNNRLFFFASWSLFIWSTLASIYVSFIVDNVWPIFLLGIPAQATLFIWLNIRHLKNNKKIDMEE